MKNLTFLLALLFFAPALQAQVNLDPSTWEGPIHQNQLLTTATFAMGNDGLEWKYYVYAKAEWMLTDNLGIEGSVFGNVGSTQNDAASFLTDCCAYDNQEADYYTHNLFFGPNYHFLPHKPVDVYAGIQPGLTWFRAPEYTYRSSATSFRTAAPDNALEPAGSALVGVAYRARFFHVFGQSRFVVSRHDSQQYQLNMNELRFTFGLGFNFF